MQQRRGVVGRLASWSTHPVAGGARLATHCRLAPRTGTIAALDPILVPKSRTDLEGAASVGRALLHRGPSHGSSLLPDLGRDLRHLQGDLLSVDRSVRRCERVFACNM